MEKFLPRHIPSMRVAILMIKGMNRKEAYNKITRYINTSFGYDYVKAAKVSKLSDVKPDVNGCWMRRMGICLDLAALAVNMLNAIGIMARLVVGYADNNPHAWVMSQFGLYDPTAAIIHAKTPKSYVAKKTYYWNK